MIIFVSYSSKNRDLVNQLARLLVDTGYDVRYDQQLETGQQWWDEILKDIRECSIFLYALSPEYLDSYPCELEHEYAEALNRHLLPVMIKHVDFQQVPSEIALSQVLDFTDLNSREPFTKLVRALNHLAQQPPRSLPTPLPPEPAAPISKLNVVIDRIANFSVTLSPAEQRALLEDIRAFLNKPQTRANARYALERFRKRADRDLATKIAEEIDSLLDLSSDSSVLPTHQIARLSPPILSSPKLTTNRLRWIGAAVALLAVIGVVVLGLVINQIGQKITGGKTPPTVATTPALVALIGNPTSDHRVSLPTATLTDTSRLTPIPPTAVPTAVPGGAVLPVTANAQWTPQVKLFGGVPMVLVPPGCFQMGSVSGDADEQPITPLCFDKAFWLDQYEVSQAQFNHFGGYAANPPGFPGDNRPVENITWAEAISYCGVRGAGLPNEAQWEYAARGPDNLVYPWGNVFFPDRAVFADNANSQPADVGSKPGGKSWVGALDMSGNVWEWTSSRYKPYPYNADDGRELPDNNPGDLRVVRGGAWDYGAQSARGSARNGLDPSTTNGDVGLRCAQDY
ncbi:MAG: SUMF1/EgtB/PvdO family nonheme iron enzyme [Aggregatilineales bacterium]